MNLSPSLYSVPPIFRTGANTTASVTVVVSSVVSVVSTAVVSVVSAVVVVSSVSVVSAVVVSSESAVPCSFTISLSSVLAILRAIERTSSIEILPLPLVSNLSSSSACFSAFISSVSCTTIFAPFSKSAKVIFSILVVVFAEIGIASIVEATTVQAVTPAIILLNFISLSPFP